MTDLGWLVRPVAHRGLHDAARGIIENTPSAIEAAIAAGYAIEVDLQEAKDGAPMVFHDETLDRLTEASGAVKSLPSEELAQIAFRDTTDRMPTLEGLLAQVGARVPLVIEIKSDWGPRGPFERRIAATLSAYRGPFALMSFDPRSVAAVRAAAPGMTRGLVADRFTHEEAATLGAVRRFRLRHLLDAFIVKPHFIAYDVNALPSLAPLAARWMFRRPLLTWTVRSEAQCRIAERWADAMIFETVRP